MAYSSPSTSCTNKESAYLAIAIAILPLWILLVTLIIFLILAFRKIFQKPAPSSQIASGQPTIINPMTQIPIGSHRSPTPSVPSQQLPTPQNNPYTSSPPTLNYGFPNMTAKSNQRPVDSRNSPSPIQTQKGKKIGSNESTGSSYYQQLMKNKGGVKSISQYGELLRQKKANAKK